MINYNVIVREKNLDDAFEKWYEKLTENVSNEKSRDGEVVGECINAITIIDDPTRCIMKSKIRKLPMRYCVGELLWYLSGNNKLSEIQKYTKAWDRMSDDGETVNSNYGYCIQKKFGFDQWEYVLNMLSKNEESRQAIIHIKTADRKESKDVNCTISLQFLIREGKLYMITYMRSNDLWMGFPNDVFQFTCMQILLSMQLGVKVGTYTHVAGSLHLYERDYLTSLKNIEELEKEKKNV